MSRLLVAVNGCDNSVVLCLHPRLILCTNVPHSNRANDRNDGHADDQEKQQANGHSFAKARAPTERSQNQSQKPGYNTESNCEVSITKNDDDEWNKAGRDQQPKCNDSQWTFVCIHGPMLVVVCHPTFPSCATPPKKAIITSHPRVGLKTDRNCHRDTENPE